MDPASGNLQTTAGTGTGEAAKDGGLNLIRSFYATLTLTAEDEEMIFRKRGIETTTITALGFRSNGKANEPLLEELLAGGERDDLLESGLFLLKKGSADLRINKQFCGWGIKGKKVGISHGPMWTDREEEEQDPDHAEWEWGWTRPILIPYFNCEGQLVGLRPHKGMGRRGTLVGTPRLYVPRAAGKQDPKECRNVIVTEGEFKAAALWEVFGTGRQDGRKPWGVAAMPGISFAKNFELREQLRAYLHHVRARRVYVAFDNEEKGDSNLPGYKVDFRKRFDTRIFAEYLATDLSRKLPLRGEMTTIPDKYRDENGKADWDGLSALVVHGAA